MAKKKTFDDDDLKDGASAMSEDTKDFSIDKVETKVENPVAAKTKVEVKSAIQLISFDRWFLTTGRPAHHKAGMRAYSNTKGRRNKAAWDQLFKNY